MKYAIIVLALVGVLAQPTAAIADVTGNAMLKGCESPHVCRSYAMGWRNAHEYTAIMGWTKLGLPPEKAVNAMRRASPTGVCIPKIVTSGQLGDILLKHLRAHPETRHRPIAVITPSAFMKAFPCPKN